MGVVIFDRADMESRWKFVINLDTRTIDDIVRCLLRIDVVSDDAMRELLQQGLAQ